MRLWNYGSINMSRSKNTSIKTSIYKKCFKKQGKNEEDAMKTYKI